MSKTLTPKLRPVVAGLTLAAAAAAFIQPAAATETINLTAIDGYPPKALWVKEFINFYIPEIDKRLAKTGNYKIKWNQAWGGQIAKTKGVLKALQQGLGDIGVVTTVFHADKVPLQMIAYATPFVTTDPGLVARTVDKLVADNDEFKAAWKKYNQVYLTNLAVLDSYQIISKKTMASLKDLEGMKIAGAGMNLGYLKGFGAAGVGGSLVTYYNKLKTGVVDGAMIWAEAANGFKMVEVAPNMLKGDIGTANSKAITFNADRWAKLPDEVKAAILDAAPAYRDHMAKVTLEVAKSSYDNFTKKGGKIVEMSAAERDKWAKAMPNIAKSWAEKLEGQGIPGKKILTVYMDAMRAAGQPILRHWDKE
ncbi:MAG: C4-dicarboxylate TRAP transporter substrate-binding protein [Rhodospirillaceae bacterium]